jgi:dephospho-CoA kinase
MKKERIGLILLTGMPGCGKEEFVKTCADRGIKILRMGDFVRGAATKLGLNMTDAEIGALAQRMREKYGFDHWAKKTAEALDDNLTLIDGLRGSAEYEYFRGKTKAAMVVVAIHASPKVRYQRLVGRGRSDAPKSYEEFEQRDTRELRWGLGEVIAKADRVIVNESTLKDFHRSAEATLDDIVKGSKA